MALLMVHLVAAVVFVVGRVVAGTSMEGAAAVRQDGSDGKESVRKWTFVEDLGAFPYMAVIKSSNDLWGWDGCSGFLVDENTVVTAASCILKNAGDLDASFEVCVGLVDIYLADKTCTDVRGVTVHPDYVYEERMGPDIALLKSSQTFRDRDEIAAVGMNLQLIDSRTVVSGTNVSIVGYNFGSMFRRFGVLAEYGTVSVDIGSCKALQDSSCDSKHYHFCIDEVNYDGSPHLASICNPDAGAVVVSRGSQRDVVLGILSTQKDDCTLGDAPLVTRLDHPNVVRFLASSLPSISEDILSAKLAQLSQGELTGCECTLDSPKCPAPGDEQAWFTAESANGSAQISFTEYQKSPDLIFGSGESVDSSLWNKTTISVVADQVENGWRLFLIHGPAQDPSGLPRNSPMDLGMKISASEGDVNVVASKGIVESSDEPNGAKFFEWAWIWPESVGSELLISNGAMDGCVDIEIEIPDDTLWAIRFKADNYICGPGDGFETRQKGAIKLCSSKLCAARVATL